MSDRLAIIVIAAEKQHPINPVLYYAIVEYMLLHSDGIGGYVLYVRLLWRFPFVPIHVRSSFRTDNLNEAFVIFISCEPCLNCLAIPTSTDLYNAHYDQHLSVLRLSFLVIWGRCPPTSLIIIIQVDRVPPPEPYLFNWPRRGGGVCVTIY